MNKKVLVGMSGGVDSSVTAYLLKEQGYDVIGVTLITSESTTEGDAVEDAKRVAKTLDIPHYILDVKEEFKKNVIKYFVEEYKNARTPNPCVVCNRLVKWTGLLHNNLGIEADYIATGHYADIVKTSNGRYSIKKAKTDSKDQSYMLFNLTQEQLAKTIFPLASYDKTEVRKIAENINARIASKNDSQEICFIPDDDYAKYIQEYTKTKFKKGKFVDKKGKVLGEHKGIIHYTIGQRKGINVNLGKKGFVTNINPKTLDITIGDNEDTFSQGLIASRINFLSLETIEGTIKARAKVRYSQNVSECEVKMLPDGRLQCVFEKKQRAVTPGQALVVYDDNDLVILGGLIDEVIN